MALATDQPVASAQRALAELRAAGTFDQAFRAWTDFLIHWQRAVNKCDALGRRKFKGTWAPLPDAIWADELLSYMRAARNSDEHGLKPIAEKQPGGMKIGATGPGVHIRHLAIGHAGEILHLDAEPIGGGEVVVKHFAEGMKLLPIFDHGKTFPPPTSHKGQAVNATNPVELADLAMQYILGEIEKVR